MNRIKVKNIQEGMILADDVLDQNGMLILRSGQTISSKQLRIFKAWGITEVGIESNNKEEDIEVGAPATISGNVSTEVKKAVEELFRYTDKQHPAVAELMEICTLRKMESL